MGKIKLKALPPYAPTMGLGFLSTGENRPPKTVGETSLSSIDELAEFYDPYSDLNLFLVQKITQEMRHCGTSKKWSLKIQEQLLQKISPEFQSRFPHYRLGVSALKKTWEKIGYYAHQIQQQKEAITQEGKLNIHFFIRENLKQLAAFNCPASLHPSHFAHQLGIKMGECMAIIDGVRPKIDHLTKLIWSIQRHLMDTLEKGKCPYDEYDKVDKHIIKTLIEISHREAQIGYKELECKAKTSLLSLGEMPLFASLENMIGSVSALLAEKLYPASSFHDRFLAESKEGLIHFIRRHSALCKAGVGAMPSTELVRRILALYALASGLPKYLEEEQIVLAIQASYPLAAEQRPDLPQSLYAFISAELVLMRNEEYCHSIAYVTNAILSAYKQAILLPELKADEMDMLEIVIWKTLSEMEGLLEKLPYKNGLRIEEEIANILIENPKKSFSCLVHATVHYFKRVKELFASKKGPGVYPTLDSEIERKIHTWAIQGDMLYRWIQLDKDTPLMQFICRRWKQQANEPLSHSLFVNRVCQDYLLEHPELTMYAAQLSARVWIFYKYAWYTQFSLPGESSYRRFLKWHRHALVTACPGFSEEQRLEKLQEIVSQTLPLIPFDRKSCKEL
ncbi:MAG TPA: hypothetical protein VGJ00_05830 [Rhabdochlamydiaceae bacterium]|jgi:hypothetical protein